MLKFCDIGNEGESDIKNKYYSSFLSERIEKGIENHEQQATRLVACIERREKVFEFVPALIWMNILLSASTFFNYDERYALLTGIIINLVWLFITRQRIKKWALNDIEAERKIIQSNNES